MKDLVITSLYFANIPCEIKNWTLFTLTMNISENKSLMEKTDFRGKKTEIKQTDTPINGRTYKFIYFFYSRIKATKTDRLCSLL